MSDFNSTIDGMDSGMPDGILDPCGPKPISRLEFRIGAVFIILFTSLIASLFPILAKRWSVLRRKVHPLVFEFAKYFGSGVILATGFIHLLEPAADVELGPANTFALGGCISNDWSNYPYAFGICLASVFFTFVIQLLAFRIGTARLQKLGSTDDTGSKIILAEGGSASNSISKDIEKVGGVSTVDNDSQSTLYAVDASESNPASAQLLAVAILEFGIIFHSVIIGLTLAVSGAEEFNILFIVIVFHQSFEGLGLGTRLAFLRLPDNLNYIPIAGAILYSCVTPLGMAIGLAARSTIATGSEISSITGGVLDAISGGILIYTSISQLMSAEFVYNKFYHTCSWSRLIFALGSFAAGTGIMALLGKWA